MSPNGLKAHKRIMRVAVMVVEGGGILRQGPLHPPVFSPTLSDQLRYERVLIKTPLFSPGTDLGWVISSSSTKLKFGQ